MTTKCRRKLSKEQRQEIIDLMVGFEPKRVLFGSVTSTVTTSGGSPLFSIHHMVRHEIEKTSK